MSGAGTGDRVLVWYVLTAGVPPALAARLLPLLDAEERDRQRRFVRERDRRQYLLAHALTRTMLSRHVGRAPRALSFTTNRYGRPELSPPSGVSFNLSHTEGLVACALARREVGLDVEDVTRRVDVPGLAPEVFADVEVARLRRLTDPESQRELFFKLWTLKEAYIKARGMGLSLPLKRFWFEVEGDEVGFDAESDVEPAPQSWRFFTTPIGGRHRLSVAAQHPEPLAPQLEETLVGDAGFFAPAEGG